MQAFLSRYSWAVYGLIFLISVILLYLGWETNGALSNALTGVGSSLFAVFVVFVVVDRIFLMRNLEVTTRLEALLNAAKRPTSDAFCHSHSIEDLAKHALRVDICGVSLSTAIKHNKTALHSALMRGCNIRILVLDPSSEGVEAAAFRSELNSAENYRAKAGGVFEDLRHIHRPWGERPQTTQVTSGPGTLKVRLLRFPPTAGLVLAHQATASLALVELYPHKSPDRSPVIELHSETDKDWFLFFSSQFERLWNDGSPLDLQQQSPHSSIGLAVE